VKKFNPLTEVLIFIIQCRCLPGLEETNEDLGPGGPTRESTREY